MKFKDKAEKVAYKAARKEAFQKATVKGTRKSSADDITEVKTKMSLVKLLRGKVDGIWDNADNELRYFKKALNTRVGSEGGFLVPTEISTELIAQLTAEAVLRRMPGIAVYPMSSTSLEIGREDTGVTVTWGNEGDTMSSDTTKTFGKVELNLKICTCLYPLQRRLLRYATAGVEALVRRDMVQSMALAEDLAALEGTGGDQPLGLYYNPRILNTDLSGAMSWDTVLDTDYQVKAQNSRITGWIANWTSQNVLRQFKDANGRYLYNADLFAAGEEVTRLLGAPIQYTTTVPITNRPSGSESYIVGGNWSDFAIGEGEGIRIETSTEEYDSFRKDQVAIKMVREIDFALKHPESFARIVGVQIT